MNNQEIIVLFSGGTDSTLTAALMAEEFKKVHLITYDRFGLFSITNPHLNAQKLKEKYGEEKFSHRIIKVDKLFNYLSYERYIRNLVKFRFFLLSTCGLCKLAMHVRTVVYCLENKITHVCDGANQGMRLFPAQMARVIEEIKKMYASFGIEYTTPVFDFESPQNIEFVDRLHLEKITTGKEDNSSPDKKKAQTTGCKLFEMGLTPSENVKGTDLDRKMQPRCFQFILFNIFVHWYCLAYSPYEEYEKMTFGFYQDKIAQFTKLLTDYTKEGNASKLFKHIEGN